MLSSCKVVGERCLSIRHNLLSHAASLGEIKTVYGHPQALAQCKGWVEQNLATAAIVATTSNAEGARLAAASKDSAAIASVRASELYALPMLTGEIQDRKDNTTKFYVITNQLHSRDLDNTTVLRASVPHCAGGLLTLLRPFADDGINLLSLHARPNKQKCWEYDFMIIADCNHKNTALHRAVKSTVRSGSKVKFLGGYQRE
jgi:chorismate mutase/prephenate dehydratase